jgi:hypothetical protein
MVQQRRESFLQEQMTLDELTQPGWEDAANYFWELDKKYSIAELRVPVIIQPQTDNYVLAPPATTFVELIERLDNVPGIFQMAQGTSRPGSSHIWLGSVKQQSKTTISGLEPAIQPDMSPLLKAKPVEPVSFHPWI